ncbi:hypothetical protein L3Q82_005831 [Scortum barcoo]|uniref:Uncharacterized protein n=1 Tax=Scortum barcoo TaxID=214431 RepID=A0ACB8V6X1_9TELE|nr:hypothetical protein L3Q82_005831 [Scortum barcoo]
MMKNLCSDSEEEIGFVPLKHQQEVKKPPPYEKEVKFKEIYPQLPVICQEGNYRGHFARECNRQKRDEVQERLSEQRRSTVQPGDKVFVKAPKEEIVPSQSEDVEGSREPEEDRQAVDNVDGCVSVFNDAGDIDADNGQGGKFSEIDFQYVPETEDFVSGQSEAPKVSKDCDSTANHKRPTGGSYVLTDSKKSPRKRLIKLINVPLIGS